MKAMIMAAGRGERLRPLTDDIPKPLLNVGGKALIEHTLTHLRDAGFQDIVINHAHLGQKIVDFLGDGSRYGVTIQYSAEPEGALETGGGIRQAIDLLDHEPFLVINGDIWTDFPLQTLPTRLSGLAHLVLVDNPPHHSNGDFYLRDAKVNLDTGKKLTFSGIGVYSPALFNHLECGKYPLAPILRDAIVNNFVSGEYFEGKWIDVGTLERLNALEATLSNV
jgi:MurNAc alpha-1-phosphate uridylyltransferase